MNIVSIVLLSHNWKKFNKECIDSILSQNYQDFEIVFVDNCSTDWSLEEVESIYEQQINLWKIKIIRNPEDNRFTWWNNLWVKYVDKNSKYICLLSNDLVVQKNLLEELVKWIESDSKLWAVSCLIYNKWFEKKEKEQILVQHKKCMSTIFWESVYENMDKNEIESNFYYTTTLSWCCFMYKKWIVDEPFPQYYFAYAEDLYLSWLSVNMWYKLWTCLNTYINHYWSWTFGKNPSPLKIFHGNKNQIINFLIFFPIFYRILLFPLFFIKEVSHLFMWAPFMRLKAKLKAWYWILCNYSKIREERKKVKKNKKISSYYFLEQLSFKLSDKYFVNNKILSLLIDIWNIIFILYGIFVKILTLLLYPILNWKSKD